MFEGWGGGNQGLVLGPGSSGGWVSAWRGVAPARRDGAGAWDVAGDAMTVPASRQAPKSSQTSEMGLIS
jgi:hypothetical protein